MGRVRQKPAPCEWTLTGHTTRKSDQGLETSETNAHLENNEEECKPREMLGVRTPTPSHKHVHNSGLEATRGTSAKVRECPLGNTWHQRKEAGNRGCFSGKPVPKVVFSETHNGGAHILAYAPSSTLFEQAAQFDLVRSSARLISFLRPFHNAGDATHLGETIKHAEIETRSLARTPIRTSKHMCIVRSVVSH